MEIVWFRQMSILLGAFRAVFALLLTVILLGIMAGSLISASMRHLRDRAVPALMLVQALFVAATLAGLGLMNADDVRESLVSARLSGTLTVASELWFNARPVLIGVAVPALLMGFSYPLGNAIVQRVEASVGRRAGNALPREHRGRGVWQRDGGIPPLAPVRDSRQRNDPDDRRRLFVGTARVRGSAPQPRECGPRSGPACSTGLYGPRGGRVDRRRSPGCVAVPAIRSDHHARARHTRGR
jgi:hypothetical protein